MEPLLYRKLCLRCLRPSKLCYCKFLNPFDPLIKFVILIHPIERKRRIATGRMSHLSLLNSHLIDGESFGEDKRVNTLLHLPNHKPVILYPGENSINLSTAKEEVVETLFPSGVTPLIFVIDGTWNNARRMFNRSPNLKDLPKISFNVTKESNFRVRKQPKQGFLSTIEAIHQTVDLLGPHVGFDVSTKKHDALLSVFDGMVDMQMEYIKNSDGTRHPKKRVRAGLPPL